MTFFNRSFKFALKSLVIMAGMSLAGLALGQAEHTSQSIGPSSNVAWTPQTLNLLRSGDPTRGASLNLELECNSCHGGDGVAVTDIWPSVAGQPAGYTFKILKDYQDQKNSLTRRGQLMAYLVEEMTDQDIVDLAAFYESQPLPPAQEFPESEEAKILVQLGDPNRLIPPCSVCHGNSAQGSFPDFSALAGQSPEYLTRVMLDFKSGMRANDVYSRMRLIAGRLTNEEIFALANYYATMGTPVATP